MFSLIVFSLNTLMVIIFLLSSNYIYWLFNGHHLLALTTLCNCFSLLAITNRCTQTMYAHKQLPVLSDHVNATQMCNHTAQTNQTLYNLEFVVYDGMWQQICDLFRNAQVYFSVYNAHTALPVKKCETWKRHRTCKCINGEAHVSPEPWRVDNCRISVEFTVRLGMKDLPNLCVHTVCMCKYICV